MKETNKEEMLRKLGLFEIRNYCFVDWEELDLPMDS